MTLLPQLGSADDAMLVAAYRRGDEPAARELVHRHAASLRRYLHAAGADRDEVDDMVQETFFRAFRALDRWRGGVSLRGWLFTIGTNLLRDEWHRRKHRLNVPLGNQDLPDGSDPHAEFIAAEAGERLRRGIASLPRLQREVLLRRVQTDAGYDEIASQLGTTSGAARVHYH
ncbi:MAG: RNA polymerase sigma factor, partial [Gemmatimonadales bacterium]